MGGQAELTGPDLGAGVDADRLRSGDKLLGHAQGEPVLLARLGDDFVAIGASCTHYGGPLAEGVIDGDHVRCPWHHACFSLRTGEALRAPALNPVACWKTERRGTTVVVTEKIERDPLASTYPAAAGGAGSAPRNIVIVGAGAAGSAAMEMLRRCGYAGRITVVDPDTAAPYDRPNLSKDYLAGNAPEEWIPIRPEGFYAQHRVDLVRGRVARIDVATRTVHVDGGNSLNYDALLLAPGAEPVHLETPGDDQPHVHYLRSLADSRSIIEAAKKAKTAVVIGSSFIGLEVAAALRTRNVVVHVVAPEQVPLARVLGEQLGGFIRQLHEEHGVVFHLQHTARSIEPHAVILDNGDRIQADLVVIGAGVIGCATAFFATAAGLRTVVLDARPQPATLTTAAATGAYRLQHDNLEELNLVREGVDLFFDFAQRTGLPGYDIRLRPQGYLFCTTEPAGIDRQRRMVCQRRRQEPDAAERHDQQ